MEGFGGLFGMCWEGLRVGLGRFWGGLGKVVGRFGEGVWKQQTIKTTHLNTYKTRIKT